MLEHPDRDDAVEGTGDVAVIEGVEIDTARDPALIGAPRSSPRTG
jgi:hypothetical protein